MSFKTAFLNTVARNVEVLNVSRFTKKYSRRKTPNYNQEETVVALDHLGDFSPEIRDDLVFTSFAIGIQEALYTGAIFHFIAGGFS